MPATKSLISRLVALTLLTTIGATAMGTAHAAAPAPVGPALFAQQAQAGGLTKKQASQLQAEVDVFLAKTGGVQTAANRIEYSGAVLTVVVPGEEKVRDLTLSSSGSILTACPYYHLCAYSGPSFTGSQINLYYCNTWVWIPWTGNNGSWDNNQTAGTKMGIHARIGNPYFAFPAHHVSLSGVVWYNIFYLSAC